MEGGGGDGSATGAKDALAGAARSLTRAPDDELATFVAAWEADRLDDAFDALSAAGERWADTPRFWYQLAEAAEQLGRADDASAILDAHGV